MDAIREGNMMWKSKFGCKSGQYDVQIKSADGKGRALYCGLMKGWM